MNNRQYTNFSNYNSNFDVIINSFYKNINTIKTEQINIKKIIEIQKTSKELNTVFNNKIISASKPNKYLKIMEIIETNTKNYGVSKNIEKYLLFMFSVDPNFEVFKIYSTFTNSNDIKQTLLNQFGLYDKYLIIIEKIFVEYFLSKKKKEELNEKINKRLHK